MDDGFFDNAVLVEDAPPADPPAGIRDWLPIDLVKRTTATLAAVATVFVTSHVADMGPLWHHSVHQATTQTPYGRGFISPPIPSSVLARARAVPQRYVSDPHPEHVDSLPDYDI